LKINKLFLFLIAHPIKASRIVKARIAGSTGVSGTSRLANNYTTLNKVGNSFLDSIPKGSTKLIWVIPPVDAGGGGATTISRFIKAFHSSGVLQEIHVLFESIPNMEYQKNILRHHFRIPYGIAIKQCTDEFLGEFVVATAWQTFVTAISKTSFDKRILFLQDDERAFEPKGDVSNLIENSLPLFSIAFTAGDWLMDLARPYIPNVFSFQFGVDSIYTDIFRGDNRTKTLVAFHQPGKPRRMGALVESALDEFHQRNPSWRILTLGSSDTHSKFDWMENLGVLNPIDLSTVYSAADMGLVLSATNNSLVPLEMLASGMVVITNSGLNTEWMGSRPNLLYCSANTTAIVKTLEFAAAQSPLRGSNSIPLWEEVIDDFISGLRETPSVSHFSSLFDR
jgi:O-antigen biosynthesis protein